jgi:hypothetical protein
LAKVSNNLTYKYFRYPFLHEGETLEKRNEIRKFLDQHGYRYAPVAIDYKDYLFNAPLVRCVRKNDLRSIKKLRQLHLENAKRLFKVAIDAGKNLMGPAVPHILLIHIGTSQARWFEEVATVFEQLGVKWITLDEALKSPIYKIDSAIPFETGGLFTLQVARMKKINFTAYPHEKELEAKLDSFCK